MCESLLICGLSGWAASLVLEYRQGAMVRGAIVRGAIAPCVSLYVPPVQPSVTVKDVGRDAHVSFKRWTQSPL